MNGGINLTTQTGLVAPNSPCPKCKSYMFMLRQDDKSYFHRCKDCGYEKRPKRDWKVYFQRFMFWK